MRYFQRSWDETPTDHPEWEFSWWYFETDEEGNVFRQVEWYFNGPILRYDTAHPEDNHGGLSEVALDLDEFATFHVSKERFEQAWNLDRSIQRRAFADFLDRLTSNRLKPGEWAEFIPLHYFDKALEDIRREVARFSIEEPDGDGSPARDAQLRTWAARLRSLKSDLE